MVKPMPASTCWQCLADHARAATGAGLGHRRRRPACGRATRRRAPRTAVSIATSVSARRCRTAWNWAIGWSNWMRSSACSRAIASAVRDTPTSSCATASCASCDRGSQSPARRRRAATVAVHLDEAEIGVHAGDRRASPAIRRRRPTPTHQHHDARRRRRGRPSQPRTASTVPITRRVGHDRSRAAPPRCRRRAHDRARTRRRDRAPTTSRTLRPGARTTSTPPPAWSNDRASCHPSSATRGVERVAGVLLGGRAQAALEQLEVVAFERHRSFPRSRSRRAMMLRWISELPP